MKRTGFGGQDACERYQRIMDKRAETLFVRAWKNQRLRPGAPEKGLPSNEKTAAVSAS